MDISAIDTNNMFLGKISYGETFSTGSMQIRYKTTPEKIGPLYVETDGKLYGKFHSAQYDKWSYRIGIDAPDSTELAKYDKIFNFTTILDNFLGSIKTMWDNNRSDVNTLLGTFVNTYCDETLITEFKTPSTQKEAIKKIQAIIGYLIPSGFSSVVKRNPKFTYEMSDYDVKHGMTRETKKSAVLFAEPSPYSQVKGGPRGLDNTVVSYRTSRGMERGETLIPKIYDDKRAPSGPTDAFKARVKLHISHISISKHGVSAVVRLLEVVLIEKIVRNIGTIDTTNIPMLFTEDTSDKPVAEPTGFDAVPPATFPRFTIPTVVPTNIPQTPSVFPPGVSVPFTTDTMAQPIFR